MGRLEGRVAVITGGASGIGEATTRRFVAEGARVVVADLQKDRGEALAAELGEAAAFARCNVTEEPDVEAALALARDRFGALDILFNNAGIVGVIGPIADTPADRWRMTIDVLLNGVFLGIKHAAQAMVEQGSGVILNTASSAGITGGLGPHAYTAAKHAVIGLTKSAASELSPHGVRVNAIAPHTVTTPMIASVLGRPDDLEAASKFAAQMSPLGFAGDGSDIANAALYLASDEARFLTGHTLVVDAGATTAPTPSPFSQGKTQSVLEAGRRE